MSPVAPERKKRRLYALVALERTAALTPVRGGSASRARARRPVRSRTRATPGTVAPPHRSGPPARPPLRRARAASTTRPGSRAPPARGCPPRAPGPPAQSASARRLATPADTGAAGFRARQRLPPARPFRLPPSVARVRPRPRALRALPPCQRRRRGPPGGAIGRGCPPRASQRPTRSRATRRDRVPTWRGGRGRRRVGRVDAAGAGGEPRHTSLSQEQVPEILLRPIDPQVLETELSQRPVRTHEPLEPRRLVDEGPRRPEHHHVAGRAEPDLHVWEHRFEAPHDARHDGKGELIELHPLAEHTPVREALADDAEKVGGVPVREARQPGITGLRNDHVVAGAVDLQCAARVVHHDGDVPPS